MDAVRGWYTLASEENRKQWQIDFQELAEGLETEETSEEKGLGLRTDIWDGREGDYAHIMQLYEILVMPEPQSAQEEQTEEKGTAEREMEALAAALKEKVRGMIQQGQQQAALETIRQLQGYFPQDKELGELEAKCGGEGMING